MDTHVEGVGGEETEVKPFMYGNHMHYLDMPPCAECASENNRFDLLLKRGGYWLAERIRRTELYRKYDRRWPLDSTTKALPIDTVYDYGVESNELERIIADETVAAFKGTLTEKQLFVTEMSEQDYKPREIAAMLERDNGSGAVRWQKHAVKQKLKAFVDSPDK